LSVESCLKRLSTVKQEAEQQQSLEPLRVFFDDLIANAGTPDAGLMLRLWTQHYEAWYESFHNRLEPTRYCPPSCPDLCPNHKQIPIALESEDEYAF
jgi:hypothetical protein